MGRGTADVVVIGAGAAGLATARALQAANVEVVVLEARERIGGRVFTRRDRDTPVPVELGAEFVHGGAPHINEVVRQARLATVDIRGERWASDARRGPRRLNDFWEQLDRVMGRLRPRARDRSFQEFLDGISGSRLARERALARQWVEGFHAADPRRVSARALAKAGWPGDDLEERRIARVIDGYDRVIEWLAAPLAGGIRFAAVVNRIEWNRGRVAVYVRQSDTRPRFAIEARAAVIAVPAGVLKTAGDEPGTIRFVPSLVQKERALDCLDTGAVTRITLRLRDRIWAQKYDGLSFLHSTDHDFPVWWTAYPVRAPVITGWRGGPGARRLAQLSSSELEDHAIASIARQLRIPRRRMRSLVEAVWTHDWEHDPFARGAYSYQVVGGIDAPAALARPIQRTLFFAGEATDTEGATGTVEGAIGSGQRAATQVLRAIGDSI